MWSFVGLYCLSMVIPSLLAFLLLLPTLVFAVLSVNARGMTLDLYLVIAVVLLFLLLLTFLYASSVFIKSYYLVVAENMPAFTALEKSFTTSMSLFKTRFLKTAIVWGYVLLLIALVTLLAALSHAAGTVIFVLGLFIAITLFLIALLPIAYFRFTEYVVLNQGLTGIDALAESYRLIKNNFAGIFGRVFVLGIVVMGMSTLVSMLLMPLTMLGSFSNSMEVLAFFMRFFTNFLVQFVGGTLTFVFLYFLYKDLAEQKPRPEAYAPSGKPFLYVLATVGIIVLVSGFTALGIGSKLFIENDGFKDLHRSAKTFMRQFDAQHQPVSEPTLRINNNIENNVDYNVSPNR